MVLTDPVVNLRPNLQMAILAVTFFVLDHNALERDEEEDEDNCSWSRQAKIGADVNGHSDNDDDDEEDDGADDDDGDDKDDDFAAEETGDASF